MFGDIKAERAIIEETYTDVCDIMRNVEKEIDYVNRHVDETVYKNIPCALVMNKSPIEATDTAAFFNYTVKIFMPPEINILAGDKIVVTRYGRTVEYKNSGRPAVYATHQEISAAEDIPVLGSDEYENEN